MVVAGLPSPIGWFSDYEFEAKAAPIPHKDETLEWAAVRIPQIRLSHAAHMSLLEGAAPAWFFTAAKVVDLRTNDEVRGPMFLLKFDHAPVHTVPFRMSDVFLGIPKLREGMLLREILPVMLEATANT